MTKAEDQLYLVIPGLPKIPDVVPRLRPIVYLLFVRDPLKYHTRLSLLSSPRP